ncbi:MAG: hypothetical protein NTU83_12470 [Candidatus Hydrogenedentes bacterium]|nr:hypothetical protein [Candidatus Hydrogenedentota bacterium]
MGTMKDPKVLRDLWEVKEKAWKEVADLGFHEAIRKRLEDSRQTALALGFRLVRKKK